MRLGAISLLTLVALVAAAAGAAAWNAGSSGSGAAKARTLVGAQPTLVKSGVVTLSISVSWAATTGATGYVITRTGGAGAVGGTCSGTVTATSCSDTPVLPLQTYTYTVTPVAGSWTGIPGPGATINT
jgi:hypothetical protein